MRGLKITFVAALAGMLALSTSCVPQQNAWDGQTGKAQKAGIDGPPFDSGVLAPIGWGANQSFVITQPPPAETDVSLGFVVSADLNAATEYISIRLNGNDLGRIFAGGDGADCAAPAQETEVLVPAELFNAALQNRGEIEIEMLPSKDVSPTQCPNGFIRVVVDYCGSGACPQANPVPGAPRVVSAVSTSNLSVVVTFNEPVYEGAADPANYSIVQANVNAESAALKVEGATLSRDMTRVTLATASQNEVTYELIVTGIQDLAGNVIAAPDILVNPTRTQFAGTPAVNGGPDSDNDGLSDALEQRGWAVNVRLVGGDVDAYTVTSDPTLDDTDADGVSDADEFRNRSDPRRSDTDGDTISDSDEWNIVYSSLTNQDTDQDAIDDGLEVGLYKTSPTQADTDGDGLSDDREVNELFRNPRIADLPRPRIRVNQIRLGLDERYTFTDESGQTDSVQSNSTTALAQSDSRTFSTSDSDTLESAREAYVKGNVEAEISKDPSLTIGVEGGYKWNWQDSHTHQSSQESATATQRTYENSLSKGREFSRTSAVTREVLGASLDVDLTVENAGEIAFSISNIQVSVLQRSRFSLTDYLPIATLLPSSELISGNDLVLNLGPLVPERGPLVFSNREIFPSLVEDLMSSPRGLVFKIANFDITDEFGRNLAFSSQEARDRSAGIVIDRGDGDPIRILVALNGQIDDQGYADGGFIGGFDARGRALGLPLDYILQDILGYEKNRPRPDGVLAGPDFLANTVAAGDDVQVVPPGTAGLLPQTVIVRAGANGVLDSAPGGDDRPEVTTGYETCPTCSPQTPERVIEPLLDGDGVASSTARDDDVQLVALGQPVNPGQAIIGPGPDGVLDSFTEGDDHAIFPGQTGKPHAIVEPTGGNGEADSEAAGDDVQLIAVGSPAAPGAQIVGPGKNGVIDTLPAGDDVPTSRDCGGNPITGKEVLVRFEHRRSGDFQRVWALLIDRNIPAGGDFGKLLLKPGDDVSLAFLQDQDRDGLFAQEEFQERSSDINDDTDADELDDFSEVRVGWTVGITGGLLSDIRPDPSRSDSDGDGLSDWEEQDLRRVFGNGPDLVPIAEFAGIFGRPYTNPNTDPNGVISSNPRLADSDTDGLSDFAELFGFTVGLSIRAGANNLANTRALGDDVQKVLVNSPAYNPGSPSGGVIILPGPNLVIDSLTNGVPQGDDVYDAGRAVRTNPLNPDHDGDTRADGLERDLGGDPTNPNDSDDFKDTDLDGLSDAEEAILGWTVNVSNPSCPPGVRNVKSNKFVGDTDLDGLPDLLERLIASDPTRVDTDCDGLSDYDEFADFEQYLSFALQFSGFQLNGTDSARYGTNLNARDTDSDGLDDSFEVDTGWRVFAFGFSEPRQVYPDPRFADTDLDGSPDQQEYARLTDPRDPDTDDDDRLDGADGDPLVPSVTIDITFSNFAFNQLGSNCDGETGSRWNWEFGYEVPGQQGYAALFTDEDTGCSQACNACFKEEGIIASTWDNFETASVTLRPGQVALLTGFCGNLRESCSVYCDYAFFDLALSYEELRNQGGATLTTYDLLGEVNSIRAEIQVFLRVR